MKTIQMKGRLQDGKQKVFRTSNSVNNRVGQVLGYDSFVAEVTPNGYIHSFVLDGRKYLPRDFGMHSYIINKYEADEYFDLEEMSRPITVERIRKAYAYWYSKTTNVPPATIEQLLEWYDKDVEDIKARIAEHQAEIEKLGKFL